MRNVVTCLFLLGFAVIGCNKDDEKDIDEVPPGVIRTIANPILYPRIVELFPEVKYVNTIHPELFTDTVLKKIVLTGESEVYLTFIAEKAKYKNTVGWYSYPLGSEPASASNINIHLLFPNASAKDSGGELMQGDMLQLGETKFPKGTVIGFFLIIKGWRNGSIDYNALTNYTDLHLNAGGYQQHVLFKEKDSKDIVLGFEDMPFLEADRDYNDILFKVSDNKDGYESIYFDVEQMPVL